MSKEKLEEYENKNVMQEKSKLQKESENYLNQNCERWESDSLSVDDIAIENYLAGAEPREKRIEELEKENAELKIRKHISDCVEYCNTFKYACMQLAEAKDLIEDMYDKIPASHSDYYKDVMERARQFIKEIEK